MIKPLSSLEVRRIGNLFKRCLYHSVSLRLKADNINILLLFRGRTLADPFHFPNELS